MSHKNDMLFISQTIRLLKMFPNTRIVFLMVLFFGASCDREQKINLLDTELRSGLRYLKGQEKPLTGKVFEFYEGGNLKSSGNYVNGKTEGLQINWYENGQKKAEVPIYDGKPNGIMKSWYDNGQICSEFVMVDGWPGDRYMGWQKNGQKWFETIRENEVLVSDKVWNEKGELLPKDSEEAIKEMKIYSDLIDKMMGVKK